MGPLAGLRVIELLGLGPGPFVGMMLADMGAEVILIDRASDGEAPQLMRDIHRRGKKSILLNLKSEEDRETLFKLCTISDVIFEGNRPGVMEKLGIGPEDCMAHNPALVYGRMTGWGQTGPLAQSAGHDINYISIVGALHAMGYADRPPSPPLNLLGDYAGAMFMAFGLMSAVFQARLSGRGQVVDTAMSDSVNAMMGLFFSAQDTGIWGEKRESNFLDGGAPYYRVYETRDGKYMSLGAIEPKFMKLFLQLAELPESIIEGHRKQTLWPALRETIAARFLAKDQREWTEIFDGTDACVAPVIPFWEAHKHPHNIARNTFIELEGLRQPAPAPKFSDTPTGTPGLRAAPGQHQDEIIALINAAAMNEKTNR